MRSRLAVLLAKHGDAAAAKAELAVLEKVLQPTAETLQHVAMAWEILGVRKRALKSLGEAVRAGYPRTEIERDPEFALLRQDPQYQMLAMREEEK